MVCKLPTTGIMEVLGVEREEILSIVHRMLYGVY